MEQNKKEPVVHGTRNLADEDLTRAVLATFEHSKSERFQQVMQSLVRHLHAFVKDVEVTEDEWFKAIDFLTRTGHITDDKRQEREDHQAAEIAATATGAARTMRINIRIANFGQRSTSCRLGHSRPLFLW